MVPKLNKKLFKDMSVITNGSIGGRNLIALNSIARFVSTHG